MEQRITHRFGSSLSAHEAHVAVEAILTRYPQYEYAPHRLS